MNGPAGMIIAIGFGVLVFYLVGTLIEARKTLRTFRDLEPKISDLLDHSRKMTAHLEEVSKNATVQVARLSDITSNAKEMVDDVKGTVKLYNRVIAKPAVIMASLAKGIQGAIGVFSGGKR